MPNFRSAARAMIVAAAGLATAAATASPAASFKGASLARDTKITLAAARHAALKARPGTITDQELERERGGSGLRYSFDITSQGKPFEVGVDARTGAVLEIVAEGNNPD